MQFEITRIVKTQLAIVVPLRYRKMCQTNKLRMRSQISWTSSRTMYTKPAIHQHHIEAENYDA